MLRRREGRRGSRRPSAAVAAVTSLLTVGVLAAFAAVLVVESQIGSLPAALPFADSSLFLFLNALSVVLIVLLAYLIGRHLVKLVFERRSGTLGSHLNLKFVFALLLVAAVPSFAQYAVSSSLITASINTWFGLQMDRAIDESDAVADAYYDAWAQERTPLRQADRGAHHREALAARGSARDARARSSRRSSASTASAWCRSFPFADAEPLATLVNPEVPTAALRAAREHARDVGVRRRRGLARRGDGQRDRRRDPRRGADPLLRSRAPRRDRRRRGGELPGAAPAGPQGRHDPRGGRRVPQHPPVRRTDRRHLPAGAAAVLARHRAVRDLVGPAHGEGRDGSDPRARRGHRRRSRAAISAWWSNRAPTTRSACWCARSTR